MRPDCNNLPLLDQLTYVFVYVKFMPMINLLKSPCAEYVPMFVSLLMLIPLTDNWDGTC